MEYVTIGKSGLSSTKTYTLLPNFEGKSLSYAENWLKAYGIKVEVEEKESEKSEGTIISQSLPERKRIDLIDGNIKFVVAKKAESVIETPTEPDIPTSGTENEEIDTPVEETPTEPENPVETPETPTTPTEPPEPTTPEENTGE